MTETVPEKPYGSVESYREVLLRVVRGTSYLDAAALGLVQSILGDSLLSDEERVARIRNVIAAAAQLDREAGR
jgi:hypothetical protein